MNITRQAIEALHREYVALTGQEIRLDMERERAWWDWLRKGFTADDLKMVVRGIRAGIREGKRNAGALKFSNLIGMPDRFEEDLALFKSAARAARPSREGRDGSPSRPLTNAGAQTTVKVSEKALDILKKFKEGNK